MQCPNCGKVLPYHIRYCPYCGAAVQPREGPLKLVLPLAVDLDKGLDEPIGRGRELTLLRDFIFGEGGKSVLLTGHEGFGGSFLIQKAVERARRDLVETKGAHQDHVILVATVYPPKPEEAHRLIYGALRELHLELTNKRGSRNLALIIDDTYQAIRGNPEIEVERQVRSKKTGLRFRFPTLKLAWGLIDFMSGDLEKAPEETEVDRKARPREPKEMMEPILGALHELAYGLPTQRAGLFQRLLWRIRKSGLPYRIVIIFDKVRSCENLVPLKEMFHMRGFRSVVVVGKQDYDNWLRSAEMGRFLRDTFQPVKCRVLWGIEEQLCKRIFTRGEWTPEQYRLFNDFVAYLAFECRGGPALLIEKIKQLRNEK